MYLSTEQAEDSSQVTDLIGDTVSPTQEMSELLGLCTGRFAGPKQGQSSPLKNTQGGPTVLPLSQDEPDDELLGLCTGRFAGPKGGQSSQLESTQGGTALLPLSQDEPDDELLGLCTAKFTM